MSIAAGSYWGGYICCLMLHRQGESIGPKGEFCSEPPDAAKQSPVVFQNEIASPGTPGSQ